jgi:hypothetical protein
MINHLEYSVGNRLYCNGVIFTVVGITPPGKDLCDLLESEEDSIALEVADKYYVLRDMGGAMIATTEDELKAKFICFA